MDISYSTQRLPLGLYSKMADASLSSEPHALYLLEKHAPAVPAPLLLEIFADRQGKEQFVMTAVPGERLKDVFHRMSYAERNRCAEDLAGVVHQLRSVPNDTGRYLASTTGGPITDHRATSTQCGPYDTEDRFNRHLSQGIGSVLEQNIASMRAVCGSHRSVFTHSDFFMTNILIDRGRLSGVVDWECAGYFPEYWEFTKAMKGVMNNAEGERFFWTVFGDKYRSELEVEGALWELFPFGGPNEERDSD